MPILLSDDKGDFESLSIESLLDRTIELIRPITSAAKSLLLVFAILMMFASLVASVNIFVPPPPISSGGIGH